MATLALPLPFFLLLEGAFFGSIAGAQEADGVLQAEEAEEEAEERQVAEFGVLWGRSGLGGGGFPFSL